MIGQSPKIVVACDSFKGSLSSQQVAEAVKSGIMDIVPAAEVVIVPVADGGEGTMEVISSCLNAGRFRCRVVDPLMRPIEAEYAVAEADGIATAIIDMASASGITLISPEERNPAITSTYGTGLMILDAWERGVRNFIVGIGGSATNDAGKGMLEALGVKFLDHNGQELEDGGASLCNLASIDMSDARTEILSASFTVICDVTNPLYGPNGAAYVFAPQKGADDRMVEVLDRGLRCYAGAVEHLTGKDISTFPGAGAAGGLGGAFAAFCNATLKSGIDTVLDIAGYDEVLEGADLVITGEGRSDRQTLCGKVPYGILRRSKGVPVVIISGSVENPQELIKAGFAAAFAATPASMSLEEAMQPSVAAENVRLCVISKCFPA